MSDLRIYRHGDPEPPVDIEAAVLTENGAIAVRYGQTWHHGQTRSEWHQLITGDMVVVGIDLPIHPDPLAVTPAQREQTGASVMPR